MQFQFRPEVEFDDLRVQFQDGGLPAKDMHNRRPLRFSLRFLRFLHLFDFFDLSLRFLYENRRALVGRAVSKSLMIVTPRCRQNVVDEMPDVF